MNQLVLAEDVLERIRRHGRESYPEEGAGLLLGHDEGNARRVVDIATLPNRREKDARPRRYLISAEDMYRAELAAEGRGVQVLGVFHSHPDHPARPSETDQEWAWPWYSYLITSVEEGEPRDTRSWRLTPDRSGFEEEAILEPAPKEPG